MCYFQWVMDDVDSAKTGIVELPMHPILTMGIVSIGSVSRVSNIHADYRHALTSFTVSLSLSLSHSSVNSASSHAIHIWRMRSVLYIYTRSQNAQLFKGASGATVSPCYHVAPYI